MVSQEHQGVSERLPAGVAADGNAVKFASRYRDSIQLVGP
jgi:hypothetical protein